MWRSVHQDAPDESAAKYAKSSTSIGHFGTIAFVHLMPEEFEWEYGVIEASAIGRIRDRSCFGV
jgi:hypothetical protein